MDSRSSLSYCVSGCRSVLWCRVTAYPPEINSSVSCFFFFLRIRRPPRSTQSRSSAASDVYKRQGQGALDQFPRVHRGLGERAAEHLLVGDQPVVGILSLIHISEPTRLLSISYAVFCLKKKMISNNYTLSTCDGATRVKRSYKNYIPHLSTFISAA